MRIMFVSKTFLVFSFLSLLGESVSCVQSRQFFASTLQEQLFELKNEDAIKKSENLRDTCAC